MEKLAGAVLDVHQRAAASSPIQLLDELWSAITARYCDEQTIDVKESLNAAREALVELEATPYEPDEMDASRADRQRRDEEAAEAQS